MELKYIGSTQTAWNRTEVLIFQCGIEIDLAVENRRLILAIAKLSSEKVLQAIENILELSGHLVKKNGILLKFRPRSP